MSKPIIAKPTTEKLTTKSLTNIVEIHPKLMMKADRAIIMVPTIILIMIPIVPNIAPNNNTQGKAKSPRIIRVITSGIKFQTS